MRSNKMISKLLSNQVMKDDLREGDMVSDLQLILILCDVFQVIK